MQGNSHKIISWVFSKTFAGQKGVAHIFKVMKKPTTKNTPPSKAIIQLRKRNRYFYKQEKAERVQHHKPVLQEMLKGLL